MAPLWHECNAGAPTEQAGGDRGDPMAGPPVEPPSHHEEEEALMAVLWSVCQEAILASQ